MHSPHSVALELTDTQSQSDIRKIHINKVGVKGLRHPVRVRDKAFQVQDTIATFHLSVDLPHHFKGTHMSRFVEVLNAHGREIHLRSVGSMLSELRARLHASSAHIEMEFPYFIEKSAPVTGSKGLVDYQIRFVASQQDDARDLVCTVIVPVTTLCPCSKAISDRGAHNQRGYVTLSVRFNGDSVWFEDMIALVEDSASAQIYSLLKRPDEKYVTEHAYDHPVFVEDLVRNIAVRLNMVPEICWYRVEAENMESIHNHAAYAMVEKAVKAVEPEVTSSE